MQKNFENLHRALYSHICERVGEYGEPSNPFGMTSEFRHDCPISPFLVNFVMEDTSGLQDADIELINGEAVRPRPIRI